jgi:endogenous inhibitor of DNA gyrase (YacG/DUF329 family)
MLPLRACEKCGRDFQPVKSTRRFCSHHCANKARWASGVYDKPRLAGTYYERNRDRIIQRLSQKYYDDPRRVMARIKAQREIPIERCESCGSDQNIDRHHDDYSKPLDVRFLCRPCHTREHPGRDVHWAKGLPRGTRQLA